jgi:hypothetical protein
MLDNAYPPPDGPTAKRSGSEKRQRCAPVSVRLLPEERSALEQKAGAADLSLAAFLRIAALGSPGPRARRRPHIDKQLMGDGLADLNRSANVLNQFLPFLHAGKAIVLGRDCSEALAANRRAADRILEALGRKEPADDNQGEPAR